MPRIRSKGNWHNSARRYQHDQHQSERFGARKHVKTSEKPSTSKRRSSKESMYSLKPQAFPTDPDKNLDGVPLDDESDDDVVLTPQQLAQPEPMPVEDSTFRNYSWVGEYLDEEGDTTPLKYDVSAKPLMHRNPTVRREGNVTHTRHGSVLSQGRVSRPELEYFKKASTSVFPDGLDLDALRKETTLQSEMSRRAIDEYDLLTPVSRASKYVELYNALKESIEYREKLFHMQKELLQQAQPRIPPARVFDYGHGGGSLSSSSRTKREAPQWEGDRYGQSQTKKKYHEFKVKYSREESPSASGKVSEVSQNMPSTSSNQPIIPLDRHFTYQELLEIQKSLLERPQPISTILAGSVVTSNASEADLVPVSTKEVSSPKGLPISVLTTNYRLRQANPEEDEYLPSVQEPPDESETQLRIKPIFKNFPKDSRKFSEADSPGKTAKQVTHSFRGNFNDTRKVLLDEKNKKETKYRNVTDAQSTSRRKLANPLEECFIKSVPLKSTTSQEVSSSNQESRDNTVGTFPFFKTPEDDASKKSDDSEDELQGRFLHRLSKNHSLHESQSRRMQTSTNSSSGLLPRKQVAHDEVYRKVLPPRNTELDDGDRHKEYGDHQFVSDKRRKPQEAKSFPSKRQERRTAVTQRSKSSRSPDSSSRIRNLNLPVRSRQPSLSSHSSERTRRVKSSNSPRQSWSRKNSQSPGHQKDKSAHSSGRSQHFNHSSSTERTHRSHTSNSPKPTRRVRRESQSSMGKKPDFTSGKSKVTYSHQSSRKVHALDSSQKLRDEIASSSKILKKATHSRSPSAHHRGRAVQSPRHRKSNRSQSPSHSTHRLVKRTQSPLTHELLERSRSPTPLSEIYGSRSPSLSDQQQLSFSQETSQLFEHEQITYPRNIHFLEEQPSWFGESHRSVKRPTASEAAAPHPPKKGKSHANSQIRMVEHVRGKYSDENVVKYESAIPSLMDAHPIPQLLDIDTSLVQVRIKKEIPNERKFQEVSASITFPLQPDAENTGNGMDERRCKVASPNSSALQPSDIIRTISREVTKRNPKGPLKAHQYGNKKVKRIVEKDQSKVGEEKDNVPKKSANVGIKHENFIVKTVPGKPKGKSVPTSVSLEKVPATTSTHSKVIKLPRGKMQLEKPKAKIHTGKSKPKVPVSNAKTKTSLKTDSKKVPLKRKLDEALVSNAETQPKAKRPSDGDWLEDYKSWFHKTLEGILSNKDEAKNYEWQDPMQFLDSVTKGNRKAMSFIPRGESAKQMLRYIAMNKKLAKSASKNATSHSKSMKDNGNGQQQVATTPVLASPSDDASSQSHMDKSEKQISAKQTDSSIMPAVGSQNGKDLFIIDKRPSVSIAQKNLNAASEEPGLQEDVKSKTAKVQSEYESMKIGSSTASEGREQLLPSKEITGHKQQRPASPILKNIQSSSSSKGTEPELVCQITGHEQQRAVSPSSKTFQSLDKRDTELELVSPGKSKFRSWQDALSFSDDEEQSVSSKGTESAPVKEEPLTSTASHKSQERLKAIEPKVQLFNLFETADTMEGSIQPNQKSSKPPLTTADVEEKSKASNKTNPVLTPTVNTKNSNATASNKKSGQTGKRKALSNSITKKGGSISTPVKKVHPKAIVKLTSSKGINDGKSKSSQPLIVKKCPSKGTGDSVLTPTVSESSAPTIMTSYDGAETARTIYQHQSLPKQYTKSSGRRRSHHSIDSSQNINKTKQPHSATHSSSRKKSTDDTPTHSSESTGPKSRKSSPRTMSSTTSATPRRKSSSSKSEKGEDKRIEVPKTEPQLSLEQASLLPAFKKQVEKTVLRKLNILYKFEKYAKAKLIAIAKDVLQAFNFINGHVGKEAGFTTEQALYYMRCLFESPTTDALDDVDRQLKKADLDEFCFDVDIKAYFMFQKIVMELCGENLHARARYAAHDEVRTRYVCNRSEYLFPQFDGEAHVMMKVWSWRERMYSITQKSYKPSSNMKPLPDDHGDNKSMEDRVAKWLKDVVRCPLYELSEASSCSLVLEIQRQLMKRKAHATKQEAVMLIARAWLKNYFHGIEKLLAEKGHTVTISEGSEEELMVLDEVYSDESASEDEEQEDMNLDISDDLTEVQVIDLF